MLSPPHLGSPQSSLVFSREISLYSESASVLQAGLLVIVLPVSFTLESLVKSLCLGGGWAWSALSPPFTAPQELCVIEKNTLIPSSHKVRLERISLYLC